MSRIRRTRVISISGSEARRVNARTRRAKWRRLAFRVSIAVAFFGLLAGYCTGRFDSTEDRLAESFYRHSAQLGLQVTDLALEGREFTSQNDIMRALGVHQGDPILAFDPAGARRTLEALPRVASAEVERKLPGTILIRIVERAPVAIWQRNGRRALIDRDGVVLGDTQVADYSSLPLLVGEGANRTAAPILDALASEPALAKRVAACIRVGDRRWDLQMDNKVEVKLPETGEDAAIHKLAGLETRNGLLEHDVVTVDLRLAGKLIVETGQPRDPKRKPAQQQGI